MTLILVGFAVYEVNLRLIRHVLWPGYENYAVNVVYLLAPLWIAGAVTIWTRSYFPRIFVGIAFFASVVHGILVCAGGDLLLGGVFILGGILMGLLTSAIIHSEIYGRTENTIPETPKLAA